MPPSSSQSPGKGPSAPSQERFPASPIESRDLLRGGRVIEIAHEGTVYRLQATRLGKLILTK